MQKLNFNLVSIILPKDLKLKQKKMKTKSLLNVSNGTLKQQNRATQQHSVIWANSMKPGSALKKMMQKKIGIKIILMH